MDAVVAVLTAQGTCRTEPCQTGETLAAVLRRAGFPLEAPCGGSGTCGKCAVAAWGALSAPAPEERRLKPGMRLACRARVEGSCTVLLPDQAEGCRVLTDGADVLTVDSVAAEGIGAALDIGTTTVAAVLYDRASGVRLAVRGEPNRQRRFGADVITRIQTCITEPDGLETLTALIRSQLREMLASAAAEAGCRADEICAVTAAGNTVMCHLLAGLSPAGLAQLPFLPKSLFGESFAAGALAESLGAADGADIWILPAVSGYFGGDAVAAAYAAGLNRTPDPTLMLDIGTNGEMALAASGRILCCAAAAGPAFEGANITCGMSGTTGAVCRVSLDAAGTLSYGVIGGGEARGICGSGLIDLLAALLELGAVDETGRLLPPEETPAAAKPYIRMYIYNNPDGTVRSEPACFLTEDVFLTGRDVRALQLAKAAIAAGIATMLDEAGIAAEDVAALVIAGGFGNTIQPVSAGRIGLIPPCLTEKTVFIGNGALTGASAALCSESARTEIDHLSRRMTNVELSTDPRFMEHYIENMSFEPL